MQDTERLAVRCAWPAVMCMLVLQGPRQPSSSGRSPQKPGSAQSRGQRAEQAAQPAHPPLPPIRTGTPGRASGAVRPTLKDMTDTHQLQWWAAPSARLMYVLLTAQVVPGGKLAPTTNNNFLRLGTERRGCACRAPCAGQAPQLAASASTLGLPPRQPGRCVAGLQSSARSP